MTLNPYLNSLLLFAKSQPEVGQKIPYLMLCPIDFVGVLFQIARRWNQLIPDYLSHLSPGYHLNPRTEVERINHQGNSLIQMIVRMKTETRMMRTMWGLAVGLRTGYHHPFVALHNR
tara:strand:- start:54 stop:404 length:351 start_codon:yes stop_codon:yes gene_type:complete